MLIETVRRVQEKDEAARWEMRRRFDILVPQGSPKEGKPLTEETRRRAISLCRVQRCFGERLRRNTGDALPWCLMADPIWKIEELLPV